MSAQITSTGSAKVLEMANIKLSSVATDIMGKTVGPSSRR